MSTDDDASTTHERDGRRGRRKTDWSARRIIEFGTVIGLLWGGYTAISSAIGARWATHSEVQNAVRPIAVKVDSVSRNLDTLRSTNGLRFDAIELRQLEAERRTDLLPGFLRLQCLQLRRDRSESLAEAAGVPCDSLLRRMR